jgi:hypothetical protein
MKYLEARLDHLPFPDIWGLPEIDATFTACRTGSDVNIIDIVDFSGKAIDRWTVPLIDVPQATETLKREFQVEKLPPGISSIETYCNDHLMRPHAAHLASNGNIFVALSDNYNGFCSLAIDTKAGKAYLLPDDFDNGLMCCTSTGSFTPDGAHWMFMRWPLMHSIGIMNGGKEPAECELGIISADGFQTKILYTLDNRVKIHQIKCSPSGRYAVFSPFTWDLRVPYPSVSISEDPDGYRESHSAGMKAEEVVTVDLHAKRHWKTGSAVPGLAHFEFDPLDAGVFYVSAHKICPSVGGVMVEGPAAVIKMRINEGSTAIEGEYSNDTFFRIRQHIAFTYKGRTLLAVTNFPNYLELIDAGTMTLWRRVELFPASPLDLSVTGNALCPTYPETCFYINSSSDGKHLVLGSSRCFSIYDIDNDRILDVEVPLFIPEGCHDAGHTRSKGE